MKYTIATGNLVDGFKLTGIFEDQDEAIEHAERTSHQDDWSIIEIEEV